LAGDMPIEDGYISQKEPLLAQGRNAGHQEPIRGVMAFSTIPSDNPPAPGTCAIFLPP
jgi:hypothetical protein